MLKIKKGDKVKIILGKDRGKTGAVEKVLVKNGQLLVAGVNLVKRHVKKQGNIEGGIIDIPKPVNVSNVMLVCPSCNLPTRVGFKTGTSKTRVCKKCKKEI